MQDNQDHFNVLRKIKNRSKTTIHDWFRCLARKIVTKEKKESKGKWPPKNWLGPKDNPDMYSRLRIQSKWQKLLKDDFKIEKIADFGYRIWKVK